MLPRKEEPPVSNPVLMEVVDDIAVIAIANPPVNALSHAVRGGLDAAFAEVVASYQQRADRAHANFVERATHSLIAHLERYGESDVWEYSPTGLRMLLRSAYTVFGTRAQSVAAAQYEAAVGDVAELYCRAFGPAVEGIQIAVPSAPQIPSPVALGQTMIAGETVIADLTEGAGDGL